uniref:Reverse transcriptase domain-containing protein n=1 Tax=Ananas comosus var. bracteatus TaxID=296719 RepID=A0A6V7PW67_ANACO|nr:unnamed protein product [Ananas comosus var. bracteatus]
MAKIISKVLASRLQPPLQYLINPYQSAFIKGHHILDNFYTAHILTHHLHSTKQKAALLKIDFERAFDNVSWDFLLKLLKARGFGEIWIRWINDLLRSTSSVVLLNGALGESFPCKRGMRQGDPLSSLPFILCIDVLYRMLQAVTSSNYLPTLAIGDVKLLTLQFVDDVLLFFDSSIRSAATIKIILQAFSESSGLKINYNKSALIPVHLPAYQASSLANSFNCPTQSFPLKHMAGLDTQRAGFCCVPGRDRLLLSPKQLLKSDYLPLLEKIDTRLAGWKGTTLSRGGRLVLLNSGITSIPAFFLLELPTSSLGDKSNRQNL